LISDLTLSLYAWTYEKPLDWGAGGPERWGEVRPYYTPPDSEDQIGFRIFDWYSAIASNGSAHSVPLINIAGGYTPIQVSSNLDLEKHAGINGDIVRLLSGGNVPPTLQNVSFYLLASETSHPHHAATWYPKLDAPLPVVDEITRYVATKKKSIKKPLRHYLLLPDQFNIGEVLQWEGIRELVDKAKPAIGFSPIEAQHAQKVSLLGGEGQIPSSIEKDLRGAGCSVERIEIPTSEKAEIRTYVASLLSSFAGEQNA
jgi:hypothetical protein